MLDKLFGWGKRKREEPQADPDIPFGRYSDNNKPTSKVARWTDADNLFKEKKYPESFDAFFEYLRDDAAQNVIYERNGNEGSFHFYQGSRIVRGSFDGAQVKAEVTLARMPQPSVPVMRRLLEMNFSLYYSRFALDNDRLCMRFDTPMRAANPNKLYYGLKELATKADKQDDLLVQDFSILETTDIEHVKAVSEREKEVKFEFFQKWLKQTLDEVAAVDADKFSGGVAYMLLALIYRIDYLITPEGNLLHDLEKVGTIYFKKDERPVTEKNRDMIVELKKLQERKKEEIFPYLFRSKYTFSIVAPQQHKLVSDSIHGANQNMGWYRDNKHPFIATQVAEYGIAFCQYSYSLPRAVTEFFHLFMMVCHPDFFEAMGYQKSFYNKTDMEFDTEAIIDEIREIENNWKGKYPSLNFRTENLRFDSLPNFCYTYTTEIQYLNMEGK